MLAVEVEGVVVMVVWEEEDIAMVMIKTRTMRMAIRIELHLTPHAAQRCRRNR
jgi:hypothetical protein